MPEDLVEGKSTLVQVAARCRRAISNYLNQCWPWSQAPYGFTRRQWVKSHGGVPRVFWTVILHFVSNHVRRFAMHKRIAVYNHPFGYRYKWSYLYLSMDGIHLIRPDILIVIVSIQCYKILVAKIPIDSPQQQEWNILNQCSKTRCVEIELVSSRNHQ